MAEFHVRDERRPGHHWADNEIIDVYGPQIGFAGYAIYMYICRYAGNRTGQCLQTQENIAKAFGVSRDTVNRNLAVLEECGLIKIERNPGKPSLYIIREVEKNLPQNQTPTCRKIRQHVSENQTGLPQNQTAPAAKSDTHNIRNTKLFEDSINTTSNGFLLPDWIDPNVWKAFEEMRKKIKKPMTERAKELVVLELDKLRNRGHPSNDVLEQSTRNCWQDVFELRDKLNGNGQQTTKAERRNADISETTRRVFEKHLALSRNDAEGS